MAQYIGVNGIARTVKKQYVGVEGIARNVKKGYVGVDGVARAFIKSGKAAGEFSVGSTLYLTFNGKKTAFKVVHQGNPSTSVYDASCNGTWLQMTNAYGSSKWDSTNNDYANSDIHTLLNGTIWNLFSNDAKAAIKQVKIPYWKGAGANGSLANGASGLSTRVFLLSLREVGIVYSYYNYIPEVGVKLKYFDATDEASNKRVVKYSSTARIWFTRTPVGQSGYEDTIYRIEKDGALSNGAYAVTTSQYFCPAVILDSSTLFDPDSKTIMT